MSRLAPLARAELPAHEPLFAAYERIMGLVPNTVLTMARVPGLVEGYAGLALAAAMNGLITEELAQMVANVASAADGCRYCQAHTAAHADHLGVDRAKLSELWSFEASDRFTADERAALRLALHSGQSPNAVTDADFAECRRFFTDDQVAAVVAVCALFEFLNRWNDTVATTLEPEARVLADAVLAPQGWTPRGHV
jgi:alkylhydroperoxidase family enzyme